MGGGPQLEGHLAGQHLDVAGAEHAGGGAAVADVVEGREAAVLVDRAAGRHGVVGVEGGEVEALAEDEDVGGEVAAAAGPGLVVAAGTGVGVGPRDAVEVAREGERRPGVGERPADPLGQRPATALLRRPGCQEEVPAVLDQPQGADLDLFSVLQVSGDGNLPSGHELLGEMGHGEQSRGEGREDDRFPGHLDLHGVSARGHPGRWNA